MGRKCGHCGADFGRCPECGTQYDHGDETRCTREKCIEVNAPIDCACGLVVSITGEGVLDLNGCLIPWRA